MPESPDASRPSIATTEPGDAPSGVDSRGTGRRIGRFTLLERLGRGGMGEVWTAYDPQLDRRVAIKLLRGQRSDAKGRARLLREAQAMARLAHPNVVAVFEAGLTSADGSDGVPPQVFIAMEFVAGHTLRRWLAAAARSRAEIVAVFVEAGRGLAAAHAAGLAHRDFKPDNVLVGDDGRVRVADLGLARAIAGPTPESATPDDGAPSDSSDRLTRTGVAAGTPAYMAPEQFLGEDVDARSDQFAFCVALWEALYGERPFAGSNRIEIASAVIDGELRSAPRGADVPPRVQEILRVGLAREPAARHPSMEALLARLADDPQRRRRRTFLLATGLVALVAAGWLGARLGSNEPAASPCAAAADDLQAVWNATRRRRLDDAMRATSVAYAERVSTEVTDAIDAWARRWSASAEDACTATRVRGEQSETLFDLRRRCLDRRLGDLAALIDVLERPDAALLERAPAAARSLPEVARCDDPDFVSAQVEPPTDPEVAERVEAIRDRLRRTTALRNAGRSDEARAAAEEALGQARAEPYPPIAVEALLVAGEATDAAGDPVSAELLLREAYLGALRLDLPGQAAGAASRLVYTVGHGLGRERDAGEWEAHAWALLQRPGADPAARTSLLNHRAAVSWHHGDYVGAEQDFREVHRRWRAEHGERSLQVAIVLTNLGAVAYARGDAEAAIRAHEEVLSITREHLGDEHPDIGHALEQLGAAYWLAGDDDRALDHFERALASIRVARGEDHRDVGQALMNLAGVELSLERHDAAREHLERACALLEANLGPLHESVGRCLHNLAVVEFHAGRDERVDELAARGRAIYARSLAPDHPEVVRSVRFAAEVAEARGDLQTARRGWADVLEARERTAAGPGDVGDARFGVARTSFTGRGGDTDAAALRSARSAHAELVRGGDDEQAAEVAAWLRERGLSVEPDE